MYNMYTFSVDMEATGNRIREMRKARGITADALAEYMGFTTPQPIYKWQRGLCLPEVPNLIALSRLFGVSVEDIIVIREAAGSSPAAFDVYGGVLLSGDGPNATVFRGHSKPPVYYRVPLTNIECI